MAPHRNLTEHGFRHHETDVADAAVVGAHVPVGTHPLLVSRFHGLPAAGIGEPAQRLGAGGLGDVELQAPVHQGTELLAIGKATPGNNNAGNFGGKEQASVRLSARNGIGHELAVSGKGQEAKARAIQMLHPCAGRRFGVVAPLSSLAGLPGRYYLYDTNSFSPKDYFYTEALRDRLEDAPATIRNSGPVPIPDHIKTTAVPAVSAASPFSPRVFSVHSVRAGRVMADCCCC